MSESSAPSATARGGLVLERERALACLCEDVAGAAEGRSGVVVIEGPGRIGKSRLLTEGRRLAGDAGARVLIARGGEVVRQLLELELSPARLMREADWKLWRPDNDFPPARDACW